MGSSREHAARPGSGTRRHAQGRGEQRPPVQVAATGTEIAPVERAALGEAGQQEVSVLHAAMRSLERRTARLQARLLRARQARARLHARVLEVEREGRRLSQQYACVEQQNSNLASLYVASYRLHSAFGRAELLETILEILANLVGSEEVAVFELAEQGRALCLLTSQGVDPVRYRRVALDAGAIGRAVASGVPYLSAEGAQLLDDRDSISACIPLRLQERVVGAIAVFRLLPQKQGLSELDRDLFDLLSAQAAMALHHTGLQAANRSGGRE